MNLRPVVKSLIKRIRDHDEDLRKMEIEIAILEEDNEELQDKNHDQLLADIRSEIRRGDVEYAVLLIDRELG